MKKQFLREIKPGTAVDDVFYVTRRDIKERRDGAPFLTFQFQDRSGTVNGIMWDGVEDALKCLDDVIKRMISLSYSDEEKPSPNSRTTKLMRELLGSPYLLTAIISLILLTGFTFFLSSYMR